MLFSFNNSVCPQSTLSSSVTVVLTTSEHFIVISFTNLKPHHREVAVYVPELDWHFHHLWLVVHIKNAIALHEQEQHQMRGRN